MYCLSACHVLLYMILYQQTSVVYLQTLTLTIETSPLVFGKDVKLKCLYSGPTCCTDDARVWTRDGTEIMNNGASSNITKYEEERNDASLHFDMKILNLGDTDFSKVFRCQYNFLTSNTVTLTKDSTYESPPTESCPFAYNPAVTMIEITGTLNITKAAPSPVLTAYYGEDNLTRYLSSTGVSNYDTWYYTLTVSTDKQIDCCGHLDDKFNLYAITGTTSTKICDIDMCECWKCFWKCFLVNWSFGISGIILSMLYCIFCGEECEKQKKLIKMTVLYGILTVIPSLIAGLSMGLYGCICNEGNLWLFSLVTSIVWGCIAIVIIDKFFYEIDWSDIFKDNKILIFLLALGIFVGSAILMYFYKRYKESIKAIIGENRRLPCPFTDASGQITWVKLNDDDDRVTYSEGTVLNQHLPQRLRERLNVEGRDLCISNVQASDTGTYECVFTSKKANKVPEVSKLKLIVSACGKSQSVESGSSCWPICRVGQDPNTSSSGPEKVRRSPEKERADKKKERKPTEVVRPQPSRPLPSRAQHLKTDNTGREEYSAENELFKPRPLPSISGHSDSPRPLPKRTPDDQLEKGGIQLEPLVESTSEKKKKKKRKKKETKQSDEDD